MQRINRNKKHINMYAMHIRIIIIKPKNSVNARASHGLKPISVVVQRYIIEELMFENEKFILNSS